MDTYLPPKYSLNSFFVRHVAHPRRMKYISGLGNAKICSVNDVGYINMPGVPANYSTRLEFPPNNFNEDLLKSENLLYKRKEKAIAPNGMWNTFGMIDNTEKWRTQLNSLASSVGLLTQSDLEEMRRKKEREEMIRNYQFRPAPRFPPPGSSNGSSRAQSAITKIKTPAARLNEQLPPQSRHHRGTSRQLSRGLSASAHLNTASNHNNKQYVIDSADRELWMLQVLCQILQTDNLTDVQSWLVSTNDSEKERVKQLIDQAMRGLEESGRISEQNANYLSNQTPKHTSSNNQTSNNNNNNTINHNQYFTNQLTNEINENKSSLAHIENALQKIDLNKITHKTKSKQNQSNNKQQTNVLKLDDDTKLETIAEAATSNSKHHANSPSDYYDENKDQNC